MADAPFMYWVGMNTAAGTTAAELAAFNEFYSNVHAPEVLTANPGFLRAVRYELCEPDPRGDLGPRWLAVYEMDGEAAAQGYLARNDGPTEGRPSYSPGPAAWQTYEGWWRLVWRRVAPRSGELSPNAAPYLYCVAMNVPSDTDDEALREFNDFYTHTHVPDVVAANRFWGGARYELYRDLRHPPPGAPRFLAVYEADDASLKAREERRANPAAFPPLSSGPPAWEAHDTLWRLLYRRIE